MLHELAGSEHKVVHDYKVSGSGSNGFGKPDQDGASGSHGKGTTVQTCIRGIRTGLQDLTGKEHQIVHAYEVSGWGCRISRVGNYRSY